MTGAGGVTLRLRGRARPTPERAADSALPAAEPGPLLRRLLAWLGLG
jgi:hypothetical protein